MRMLDVAVPPGDIGAALRNWSAAAIGGYIGGPFVYGPALGWRGVIPVPAPFLPIWVGQQAPGGVLTEAQGARDGARAVADALSCGLRAPGPICLDVEAGTFNLAQGATVAYAATWCGAVQAAGWRAYVYGPVGCCVGLGTASGLPRPDAIWITAWLGTGREGPRAGLDPYRVPGMPGDLFSGPGQRGWQYSGDYMGFDFSEVDFPLVGGDTERMDWSDPTSQQVIAALKVPPRPKPASLAAFDDTALANLANTTSWDTITAQYGPEARPYIEDVIRPLNLGRRVAELEALVRALPGGGGAGGGLTPAELAAALRAQAHVLDGQ